jgi:hypothetical protein
LVNALSSATKVISHVFTLIYLCWFTSIVEKELEELAKEAGFSAAKHYELGGGLMGDLVATR